MLRPCNNNRFIVYPFWAAGNKTDPIPNLSEIQGREFTPLICDVNFDGTLNQKPVIMWEYQEPGKKLTLEYSSNFPLNSYSGHTAALAKYR